jgi:hypothetical protein
MNPLVIVLSVLLRYTDSDYPFGIFKLFLGATDRNYNLSESTAAFSSRIYYLSMESYLYTRVQK